MGAISGFGQGLRRLREDSGLSQTALGQRAGVTQSHLSAYETGKRLPNVETVGRILDALGADFLDLHNMLSRARSQPLAVRPSESSPGAEAPVPTAPERVLVDLMRQEVRRLAAEAAAVLDREGLGSETLASERLAPGDREARPASPALVAAGDETDV